MSAHPTPPVYWSGTCPHCDQGRLAIQQRTDTGALYLHCEECERGWRHPEEVRAGAPGFLTLLEDFASRDPTQETLRAQGWDTYISGRYAQ